MKNFIRLIVLFALVFVAGCDKDDLNQPVFGTQENSNYYQNADQIKEALTGAYLQLRITWDEFALNHYMVGDVTTDDAWKGGANEADYMPLADLQNFTATPTNHVAARRWNILYKLIARSNEVIHFAQTAAGDETLLQRYINEAKLLRGFAYYELVTVFGGVPLVLEPLTPSEAVQVPRASEEEVFNQIITDLNDATALPTKSEYGPDDQYRVTSGLAYALLGKLYMFMRDFEAAEEALAQVVNSGEYALLPDYGANWRIENSVESVFEINNQMTDERELALGSNIPLFFSTRTTPGYPGYGFHLPTLDLFKAFAPDDPRIAYTFVMEGDRFVGDSPQTANQDNSLSPSGFGDRKTLVPQILRTEYNPWMVDYNVRLIRYSDVLLLYAEALNENGKSAEALTYLNMVRERARNTPPLDPQRSIQTYIPETTESTLPPITTTDQDELRDIIWHERRVELGMEGWRREDLVRQERYMEVMLEFAAEYNTLKGADFDPTDILLPIPQTEIDYSNGVIQQNPGY